MKLTALIASVCLTIVAIPASAQQDQIPKNIADSVGGALRWTEGQFLSVAEAMPEAKYSFIPSGGNFEGVRSFAEQVKHVACARGLCSKWRDYLSAPDQLIVWTYFDRDVPPLERYRALIRGSLAEVTSICLY